MEISVKNTPLLKEVGVFTKREERKAINYIF